MTIDEWELEEIKRGRVTIELERHTEKWRLDPFYSIKDIRPTK